MNYIIYFCKRFEMKEIREYLNEKINQSIIKITDYKNICEIRLRVNNPLIVNMTDEEMVIKDCIVSETDIKEIFNNITEYSAYAYEYSIKNGYLTLEGGHRAGFGGEVVYENEKIVRIKNIRFLNIRVSHSVQECGRKIADKLLNGQGVSDTLIISPPGLGKTTLLRDLVRIFSTELGGTSISVIDERNEIAASCRGVPSIDLGIRTDVISNCTKDEGIRMAVRALAPKIIAVDEIGSNEDIEALLFAKQSGVSVIATIHGESIEDAKEKLGQAMDKLFKKKVIIRGKGEYICY